MQEEIKTAVALDRFAEAYDPYNYRDCIDNSDLNILGTLQLIHNGEIQGILNWLEQIADDEEEGNDNFKALQMLLHILKITEKPI